MDANIQKYQAFVEVADAGSFTKAAETLAYSQSGISHMVSDLERDWGVALFERSRRGVVLTGDGARLLPEARALCESFRALEATVDEVRGTRDRSHPHRCVPERGRPLDPAHHQALQRRLPGHRLQAAGERLHRDRGVDRRLAPWTAAS